MIKKLQEIGLTEKEATIYIELLKFGTHPASLIAKKVSIPKSTANFTLEELTNKGFATKTQKGNTFLYTAEAPATIISVLEYKKNQKIAEENKKIESVKSILTELQSIKGGSNTRPKIKFYEGIEGMKKVYEDTLTSTETIRSFASFDGMHGALPEYFKTYYKRRVANGIFIRSIHPDTPLAREKSKNNKNEWRDNALIPISEYNFTPEIQFYDNKVNIASLKEKLGIIIESKEIYDTMVVAFELAWKEAKRF